MKAQTGGRETLWVRGSTQGPSNTLRTKPVTLSSETQEEVMRIARFALVVCHELGTPLTSLISSLGALQEFLHARPESMEGKLLDNALRSADIIKTRTADMLELVNIRIGLSTMRPRPVAVGSLIRGVVNRLEPRASCAKVRVQVDIAAGLPTLTADPSRLEQVVRNLIQNAIEHAAEGHRVEVRARSRDGLMIIEVQDYGPGIDPERKMKIYHPEYCEAAQSGEVAGMGIGLELCKVLLEEQGGRIVVVTEQGKGSLFSVELPLSKGEAAVGQ